MPFVPAPAKVLVTGSSGLIGAWIVKVLVERGYSVHATYGEFPSPMLTR